MRRVAFCCRTRLYFSAVFTLGKCVDLLTNCDSVVDDDVQYASGTSDHLHLTSVVSKYSKEINIHMKRFD